MTSDNSIIPISRQFSAVRVRSVSLGLVESQGSLISVTAFRSKLSVPPWIPRHLFLSPLSLSFSSSLLISRHVSIHFRTRTPFARRYPAHETTKRPLPLTVNYAEIRRHIFVIHREIIYGLNGGEPWRSTSEDLGGSYVIVVVVVPSSFRSSCVARSLSSSSTPVTHETRGDYIYVINTTRESYLDDTRPRCEITLIRDRSVAWRA